MELVELASTDPLQVHQAGRVLVDFGQESWLGQQLSSRLVGLGSQPGALEIRSVGLDIQLGALGSPHGALGSPHGALGNQPGVLGSPHGALGNQPGVLRS